VVRQGLRKRALAALALAGLLALGCGLRSPAPVPAAGGPPAAPREFRAAWVATVANIDWPSRPGLPAEAQRQEVRDLVARARALGLNALILQVRPAADALYPSALEPWSEYLSGRQGQGPEPPYDPLAFWIKEAHAAGLELHAWFNPYRARQSGAASTLAPGDAAHGMPGHVALASPGLVRSYGDLLWLDPGEPGAADHALAVVLDVVRRYDVDGVHVDDYFYPYPIKDAAGQEVPFPDEPSWQAYLGRGGALSRPDWRRRNVDDLIERIHREVHALKPEVRVGVSPFGLGRPELRPPGIKGFSAYDGLFADAEHWLEAGWLDYLAPQLYWKRDAPGQAFGTLLDHWRAHNPMGRHIWPGLFTSRLAAPEPWPAAEILGQISLTRAGTEDPGHIHFSMVTLSRDVEGIGDLLRPAYGGPALVPATPWLGGTAPPVPAARLDRSGAQPRLVLEGTPPWLLAVWGRYGTAWRFYTLPGGSGSLPAGVDGAPLVETWACSVGRTGLASLPVRVQDVGTGREK